MIQGSDNDISAVMTGRQPGRPGRRGDENVMLGPRRQ
jgi:hypothetical protein